MTPIIIDFSIGPRVWDKVTHVTLFNNDHVCGNCNGSGLRDYMDYCRVCDGTGKTKEPAPETDRQVAKSICQMKMQAGTEEQIDAVLAVLTTREEMESFKKELQEQKDKEYWTRYASR
jgi:DnaJ-class molecular chaperone